MLSKVPQPRLIPLPSLLLSSQTLRKCGSHFAIGDPGTGGGSLGGAGAGSGGGAGAKAKAMADAASMAATASRATDTSMIAHGLKTQRSQLPGHASLPHFTPYTLPHPPPPHHFLALKIQRRQIHQLKMRQGKAEAMATAKASRICGGQQRTGIGNRAKG